MIKITCTSCQKALSLDESKLPMKEVAFPCPVCKTKLTVDRRTLDAPAGAPHASETAVESVGTGDANHEEEHGFGAKALIVGADSPALRQAAKLTGHLPVYMPTAEEARAYFSQEFPPVVFVNPPQITPPPLEAFAPIISLAPADRRKTFLVLFSDSLRTLDGNAAFLYGVNLVVATKDLSSFSHVWSEAFAYHERLYAPMNSVVKAMHQ